MYKTCILAASIAILPVSKSRLVSSGQEHYNISIGHYQSSFPGILQPTTQESKEPYSLSWFAAAQEDIRKSEYNFKWEEKLKAYCTPNRKNNLRFYYNDKGFTVEPRTTKIPIGDFDVPTMPDETKYKTVPNWKVKFNLDKNQVGNGKWQIANNKAEYITEKITVQYINNDEGMRQNFIVHQPFAGRCALSKAAKLKINFTIKTKLTNKLSQNQLQFFHKKTNVLIYDQLKVWDAKGKSLEASFQKIKKNKYCIKVDDRYAVYPITIDPISTTPASMLESNQVNANLGFSVASAGDVNGDGYSDVIAGAHAYDNTQTDEGAAFVFHGSATGINTTPAVIVESNVVGARLGISVSTAGDVNGDGYSDIVVGANNYTNTETWEGAAYIYHGSATGINTTAAIMMESNQAQAQMGFSVACGGDVNSDGYSDVIVGVWLFDNPEINEGVAYVYHGSNSGITGTVATILEANQSASNFGIAVAGAGDVNGDGYSDVIVGAENYNNGQAEEGAVFIYHGSVTGIINVAVSMAESNQGFSQFGFSVSSAGDVNGDGYSDVIVGAYTFDNGQINEGVAFIYHGSVAGINNAAADTLEPNLVNIQFGVSVACAGDINGDGYSDVIAGAQTYDNVQTDEGAAYVYFGSQTGINANSVVILESNQAGAQMGRGVASAGDVNGDGYSDVIAGIPQYDNLENNEGAAFVYHGSASGINTTATAMVENNQVQANMGCSVASAGDVNGDGYSDVIVGAFLYDNGQTNEGAAFIYHGSVTGISTTATAMVQSNETNAGMGYSVASAGDLNGDGYSDVIVGATSYDNSQTLEGGAALVYHGSPTGINTSPAAIIEGNQFASFMGCSVASAGDVNGDGYSDVIVGAERYTNGQTREGAAFVYHGSPTGINTSPAAMVESNQADAYIGISVASAGDVNGDGYSDVIVGAYGYYIGQTDEGAAFVYHGSPTGINTSPAAMVESNQAGAVMGYSVASAGDVNGDGYSDVIAGAFGYENGQTGEGAAFVYHGSPTGINTSPAAMVECNQEIALMGFSVACAGDVNGDGYSDVIVAAYLYDNGQTDEGAAFVYHGSPTGLNTSPAAMVESNQESDGQGMGNSVNSAGDVNGDGYSDVIVGAAYFFNGQFEEGAAFVYMGNNPGTNKRNNLRLYNTDLTTPINSSNFIFSNFGAGLYAKSFLGRDKGKMVWETRLSYNAYSGMPITNSTFFTSQQAAFTDMGIAGIELKNLINKISGGRYTKLRARIKYNPVTAITGQVYSPWRNVSSIIDANNLGVLPIDLISFKASWLQKGKTARLDFVTDKESGICCFDIEKSLDGFNFFFIGSLPAKNTSGMQAYSFTDKNATGKKQFYRLKIKGITSQVEYSNIQQLQHSGTTEILVFPNPTTDVLHLQLNNPVDKITVRVVNAAGQLVKHINGLAVTNQTLSIPVKNLAPGTYWLHLQVNDKNQTLQFLKQ